MKNVVYIGGFGHWPDVAEEFRFRDEVQVAGFAPAYADEDISGLMDHPALPSDIMVAASVEDLLRNTNADIAVVSTRLDLTAQTVVRVANAGCDIICEKPLGISHDQLRLIRDAVKTNGIRLIPMLSMRSEPVFYKARELCSSGAIGEAALINVRKSYRYGNRPEWFGRRSQYGGTFPWVGIHAADMACFITGLQPVSVTARHSNFAHPERLECEDRCVALMEMNNQALLTMSLDLLRPEQASTHGDHWIRIVGSKGVLEASMNGGWVKVSNQDGDVCAEVSAERMPLYLSLLEEDPCGSVLAAAEDGFQLTEAMLYARDSADRNGEPVLIQNGSIA